MLNFKTITTNSSYFLKALHQVQDITTLLRMRVPIILKPKKIIISFTLIVFLNLKRLTRSTEYVNINMCCYRKLIGTSFTNVKEGCQYFWSSVQILYRCCIVPSSLCLNYTNTVDSMWIENMICRTISKSWPIFVHCNFLIVLQDKNNLLTHVHFHSSDLLKVFECDFMFHTRSISGYSDCK